MKLDPNTPHSVDELSEVIKKGKFHVLTWLTQAYREGFLKGYEEAHDSYLPHFLSPGADGMARVRLMPDELLEYVETAYRECGVGGDEKPKAPAKSVSKPKASASKPEVEEDSPATELKKPDPPKRTMKAADSAPPSSDQLTELIAIAQRIEAKVSEPAALDDAVIAAVDESVARGVAPVLEGQNTLRHGQAVLQQGQRNLGESLGFLTELLTGDPDAKEEVIRLVSADLDDIEDPLA